MCLNRSETTRGPTVGDCSRSPRNGVMAAETESAALERAWSAADRRRTEVCCRGDCEESFWRRRRRCHCGYRHQAEQQLHNLDLYLTSTTSSPCAHKWHIDRFPVKSQYHYVSHIQTVTVYVFSLPHSLCGVQVQYALTSYSLSHASAFSVWERDGEGAVAVTVLLQEVWMKAPDNKERKKSHIQ